MAKFVLLDSIKKNKPELYDHIISGWGGQNSEKKIEDALRDGAIADLPHRDNFSPEAVDRAVNEFSSGDRKGAYTDYLSEFEDETNLTQEELQGKIDSFKGLEQKGETPEELVNMGESGEFFDSVKALFSNSDETQGFDDDEIREIIRNAVDENAVLPTDPSLRQITEDVRGLADRFQGGVNNTQESVLTPFTEYGDDIKRVQDQIDLMVEQGASQDELNAFIDSLPDALKEGRDEYLEGEVEYGADRFKQDLQPRIKQNLASRGMLRSGDLSNELTRGASEIAGNIQDIGLDLQADDEKFFTDMAYGEKFKEEIVAGESISNKLSSERDQATFKQKSGFLSGQAELNRRYNEMISKKESERSLANERSEYERSKKLRDSANDSTIYGDIAKIGGQVATAYTIGKINKGTTT